MSEQLSTYEIEREARQRADRTARAAMYQYAHEIAQALGPQWSVLPSHENDDMYQRNPHIVHADGYGFWMSTGAWNDKGKFAIAGIWPKDKDGREAYPYFSQSNGESAPGIKFSQSKTPAVAAKDIVRRFLPEYMPYWDRETARHNSVANARRERHLLATEAAHIVGGTVAEDRDGYAVVRLHCAYESLGIREVELGYDGVIKITVSGKLDMLRAVQAAVETVQG